MQREREREREWGGERWREKEREVERHKKELVPIVYIFGREKSFILLNFTPAYTLNSLEQALG